MHSSINTVKYESFRHYLYTKLGQNSKQQAMIYGDIFKNRARLGNFVLRYVHWRKQRKMLERKRKREKRREKQLKQKEELLRTRKKRRRSRRRKMRQEKDGKVERAGRGRSGRQAVHFFTRKRQREKKLRDKTKQKWRRNRVREREKKAAVLFHSNHAIAK